MSDRRVGPAAAVAGEVHVPGDKSISHRGLIVGAIARGRSYLGNVSPAADVRATAAGLRACGAAVRDFGDGRVGLDGAGPGRSLGSPAGVIDCANSGTTMRLLGGVLAGSAVEAVLDGDRSLRRRPMERVAEPLRALGATVTTTGGHAPLRIRGTARPRGVEHRLPLASAQVKSAILLAGLSAEGPTRVIEPVSTRDHTERLLRLCGLTVTVEQTTVTLVPGVLQPFGLRVPGDLSSASFFLALAAARRGWAVRCPGVGLNPGRTGVLDVLAAMGAAVTVEGEGAARGDVGEPQGTVAVAGARLHAVSIGAEMVPRCVDELPVIAVLATQAEGETVISGAAELRHKESDRIATLVAGLRRLGADVEEHPDGLAVRGPTRLGGGRLASAGDHRLAMAWAVAGCLSTEGVVVEGADAVDVSYPGFFDALERLLSGSR